MKNFGIKIALIAAVIMSFNGCSRNPVTGKKEVMLMSKAQEQALGAQYDPQISAAYGVYKDTKMQAFINDKGKQMGRISHRPELNYQFKIMDSPVVNAFAVPGGYVYFTRGIMAHFNNEAEFAGVLGHEIGHVTARHSAQQQTKATFAQIGLVAGIVAGGEQFAQFAGTAQQGLQMLFLKFGRDDESQSDKLGVEYSTRIGYDAKEMAGFFSTLDRLSAGRGDIPNFLSTHPHPTDRFKKVGEMAKLWQKKTGKTNYKINRNQYLRMIDGLVYGEDPRQGYVDKNVFYHPEMKFQFPTPSNWKVANSPAQVQIAEPNGKAAIIFQLAQGTSPKAAAQKLVEEAKLKVAESGDKKVNGLNAFVMVSDQVAENQQGQQQQGPRILSYFIQYGSNIYAMHGLSSQADFQRYFTLFQNTMEGFDKLTDQSKINVKPERIAIKTISKSSTLKDALLSYNTPANRLEELAILNGMKQTDRVTSGMLIKAVEKK